MLTNATNERKLKNDLTTCLNACITNITWHTCLPGTGQPGDRGQILGTTHNKWYWLIMLFDHLRRQFLLLFNCLYCKSICLSVTIQFNQGVSLSLSHRGCCYCCLVFHFFFSALFMFSGWLRTSQTAHYNFSADGTVLFRKHKNLCIFNELWRRISIGPGPLLNWDTKSDIHTISGIFIFISIGDLINCACRARCFYRNDDWVEDLIKTNSTRNLCSIHSQQQFLLFLLRFSFNFQQKTLFELLLFILSPVRFYLTGIHVISRAACIIPFHNWLWQWRLMWFSSAFLEAASTDTLRVFAYPEHVMNNGKSVKWIPMES